jgi:hypothetical protein
MKGTSRVLVIALIALVASRSVASSQHELTVRHVRCAEHDELTHVQAAEGAALEPRCESASVVGANAGTRVLHDHCWEGFIARGRLLVSHLFEVTRLPATPSIGGVMSAVAIVEGQSFLLASAPKTSPPSA